MESFLNTLFKNGSPLLAAGFQVIVLPMVNPDGVVYGNFRTNLAGFDLNRQWLHPNRWLHPQIYFIKKFILSLGRLQFVLDLHGHSKKFGSFIYACKQQDPLAEKYFPYLMQSAPVFSLRDCTYGITADKTTTARATISNIGIKNVYTVETSFYGWMSNGGVYRLSQKEFDSLGATLLTSLERYFLAKESERRDIEAEITSHMWQFQQWELTNNNDSGSQSNPSEDEFTPAERKERVMCDALINRKVSSKKKKKKKKKAAPSEKLVNHTESLTGKAAPKQPPFRNTYDRMDSPVRSQQHQLPPATTYKDKRKQDQERLQVNLGDITGTKYRSGLFRRETRRSYLPPSDQRQKKKSLSNLLPEEPKYGNETDSSRQLEPAIEKDDTEERWSSTGKDIGSSNRLLLQYSRKMKTREKLETILNTNRLQDRININIGRTVKREIEKSLEAARQDYRSLQKNIKNPLAKEAPILSDQVQESNLIAVSGSKKYEMEQRRLRRLKPVAERSASVRKQQVYLSELMKPKASEDSRIVCLKIEQDIVKQMKARSNSIRERQVFIDYRIHY